MGVIFSPFLLCRRGLSQHFHGKSQSFTSLSNVRCLEDLAKPENPYNKKLKSCKSYGGLSSSLLHRTLSSSRIVPQKASNSRVSCSSLGTKRTPSFLGNKPPMPPPHRSNRTPWFAWCNLGNGGNEYFSVRKDEFQKIVCKSLGILVLK